MSVTRTPGRCRVKRPTICPSGRTAKLGQRLGCAVELFALIHMWFSAARQDIVEALLQIAPYAGFPVTWDALARLDEIEPREETTS